MEEKKLKKGQDQEKNKEQKQGVLELIEDSLGDVSGGLSLEGGTNLDNYDHWGEK